MDILEYTEKKADETVKLLRGNYDDMHERIQKIVTALVGGAGAVGAYAVSRISAGASSAEWVSLAVLAAEWFLIAVFAALEGARSRELSPGNGPDKIRKYFDARLDEIPATDADRETKALAVTRHAELDRQQIRLTAYKNACSDRALVLDNTYLAVAASPVLPAITFFAGMLGR